MSDQGTFDFTAPLNPKVSAEDRAAAIEKIQKLLRMKRGGTQSESETAERLAEVIALKAGIDLSDVSEEDTAARLVVITHRIMGEWSKEPTEAFHAGLICRRFFNISTFAQVGWTEKRIFVGTELDLDIAAYVFNCCVNEFRHAWNKRRGRCKKRAEFIYGCYVGLFTKLKERFPKLFEPAHEGNALVVSMLEKRRQYIEEHFGPMETKSVQAKNTNNAAAARGFHAGRDIELRPGIKGGVTVKPEQLTGPGGRLLLGNGE